MVEIQPSEWDWYTMGFEGCFELAVYSLSMKPFAIGWYAVVQIRLDPSSCISCVQSADSNWDPRSVVIVDGTPNLEIHPLTKACATVLAACYVCDWDGFWPAGESIIASKQVGIAS